MEIRVHRILKGSRANGPGRRNVVWLQGCTLNCPGCFNPLTHDPAGGTVCPVEKLCENLLSSGTDGITISGGEPFQQPEALFHLLCQLRKREAPPVLVFSGYEYKTLCADPILSACLPLIDALICGPYKRELPPDYSRFCSSSNQKLILLSDRYSGKDFNCLPVSEILIDPDGSTVISGILKR